VFAPVINDQDPCQHSVPCQEEQALRKGELPTWLLLRGCRSCCGFQSRLTSQHTGLRTINTLLRCPAAPSRGAGILSSTNKKQALSLKGAMHLRRDTPDASSWIWLSAGIVLDSWRSFPVFGRHIAPCSKLGLLMALHTEHDSPSGCFSLFFFNHVPFPTPVHCLPRLCNVVQTLINLQATCPTRLGPDQAENRRPFGIVGALVRVQAK
jgi:hypothetical protein